MATEQKAQLNYLMITPRKVRLIANTIKGLSVVEAEAQLLLRPQRASAALLKLLRSAISNAKNNLSLAPERLRVARIWVDPAPVIKRSLPRSQGRATPLLHRMSHITLILGEIATAKASRFIFTGPEKNEKKDDKKTARAKAKADGKPGDIEHTRPELKNEDSKSKEATPKKSKGAFKRFFNRKSI